MDLLDQQSELHCLSAQSESALPLLVLIADLAVKVIEFFGGEMKHEESSMLLHLMNSTLSQKHQKLKNM
jgi:hypothetical protein